MMDKDKPKPLQLAQTRAGKEEAERAKRVREFAEAIDVIEATWPTRVRLLQQEAREWRVRFLALQKEGFTAGQAMELCWRRG